MVEVVAVMTPTLRVGQDLRAARAEDWIDRSGLREVDLDAADFRYVT